MSSVYRIRIESSAYALNNMVNRIPNFRDQGSELRHFK